MMTRIKLYVAVLIGVSTALATSFAADAKTNSATTPPMRAGKYPAMPKLKKEDPKKTAEKKNDSRKPYGDEKPFADIVKDMDVIKGVFTFYHKAEDNKIYLEISTNQFDKTFLFSGSIEQAIGERGFYSAQMGGHFPFQFRLVGKNIQWVVLNSTFTAQKETPADRATRRSFPNSILASAKILSQPHPERKSFLVNLSDLILSDIPGLAPALTEAYRPSSYRFDKANSAITRVKAFTENAVLDVALHFVSDSPKTRSLAIPDERSVPMLVKYDFSNLRESDYKERFADDRVGHFLSLQQDFTSDRPSSPYVRRIHRWNLEKANPIAAVSEPKEPITFWLENTVPVEYRAWMKEGVLIWNQAFEKIGFKNAIVVKQQPDDADWDAADTRYNVIRWFAGVDASFAIGPSRANPYTGEIYDADIGFSEGIIRSIRRNGEEFISPIMPTTFDGTEQPSFPRLAWDQDGGHLCKLADGLAHQAAFGMNVLATRGTFTPEMEERMMREYIIHVTAHEVGHTLGLRHNFRASTLLNPDELLKDDVSEKRGQSGSVMDYNPIVIAGKDQKQGHFVPTTLGPYDFWAIEYAYKPFADNESDELKKIAARAAEPELAYSTDEDALGTYSAAALDPLVNQFDQSSDPIRYFENRIQIINELWESIEKKLVRDGEGYQILRRAVMRSLGEYYRGLLTASKFIGGLYHYRDHVGDKDGRSPFAPIPAAKQKEALEFMRQYCFSEEAFELSPELYNKLAPERLPGLDGLNGLFGAGRVDTPWHDSVLNLQRAVLARLHASATLARLQDNELRFKKGEPRFGMADMFLGLETAIWAELHHPISQISSLRRNLQREHLKTLSRISLRNYGVPEDATSLARASLSRILENVEVKLKDSKLSDTTTRAHLEETRARIKAALEAQIAKGVE
ncbi:MAG TPA: zinc-dependent metalloprotease [Verrucomicrobiae bacterium]